MKEEFLLIIDGSSLLSTQYYGNLPREILFAKTEEEKQKYYHKIMQTPTGIYTNAVYGFIRTLLKILKEQKPSHLAITWDISRDTFRRQLYADYKGNRGELPEPLREQYRLCQDLLHDMNIAQFMDEQYEADDFSGTLAAKFEEALPVKIFTKDNDYLQLVTERTTLWLMHGTQKKTEELYQKYGLDPKSALVPERCFPFTPELVEKEFQVPPKAINSLKGLQGDSSDNIKGVPGVGEATAAALIKEYGSVEGLYQAIKGLEEGEKKEIAEYWKTELLIKRSPMTALLKESETELVGEAAAMLSKTLATIKQDIELPGLLLSNLRLCIHVKKTEEYFEKLGFKSLHLTVNQEEKNLIREENFHITSNLSETEEIFSNLLKKEKACLGVSLLFDKEEPAGVALSLGVEKTYLFLIEGFLTGSYLKEKINLLKEYGHEFTAIHIKRQLSFLEFSEQDAVFDVAVAAYLLDPLAEHYHYEEISNQYLEVHLPSEEELTGKGKQKEYLTKQALLVPCYESSVAALCQDKMRIALEETGMLLVFLEIEMPLIFTLHEMECRGIRVNKQELEEYGKKIFVDIEKLEQEIYQDVGETFNINSPKQLGVILFEKLQLPFGKKTKTGYSTSADILERIQKEHPVVSKVLEYRQLSKLKSTYADGLAEYIKEDGRIHSTFHQLVTATGRISSTEPNLQNIPIRMELGRLIRKVFVPEEGFLFLDADYSQIELRILAHMSEDKKLIEAYQLEQDIHKITASQVFHTPLEEVTKELRSNAKAVNFGIVYGISSFGLGQGLNISKKEAERYILQYFKTYPQVKAFLDYLVSQGQEKGYVTTLFGRRRPIPELSSSNFMQRSFGERVAMNSPIQGTAADIIKIAMLRVNRRLKELKLRSRLLLQIHDELLVETLEEEQDIVRTVMEEEMQGAAKLSVKLETEVKSGYNWYDAK